MSGEDTLTVEFEAPPERAVSPADVYSAMIEHAGNVGAVCAALDVRRKTITDMLSRIPAIKVLKTELVENVLDKAEDNVFKGVLQGDRGDSKFILSTLGKERGYSTKVENTPDVINIQFKDFG